MSDRLFSLLDKDKLRELSLKLETTLCLPGNVAECGVYKGGSAIIIAERMSGSGKHLLLFDTFHGIPDQTVEDDYHRPGDFGDTSLSQVTKDLSAYEFVAIYPGTFRETFKLADGNSFCFVHVDCDLYSSVMECCEFFYDKVVDGGIMLFDDYGSATCAGAKRAVDEFFADKPEVVELEMPAGTVTIVKGKRP